MKEYKTREQKRAFYRSPEWLSCKAEALERDHYECQECKRLGYLTIKESKPDKQKVLDVDHIKEIENFLNLRLTWTTSRRCASSITTQNMAVLA